MEVSLKRDKLITMDWIDEYIEKLGLEGYCDFENRVNKALDQLRPGKCYDIATDVKEEDQELFIKICCCYINQHPEYEMSDDYCRIYNRSDRL